MTRRKRWHDDDRFWKTFSPWMFDENRLAATPAEVDSILELLDLPPRSSILDLCCGPGRHSLELARRGHRVVGVDRTREYLAKAQKQAKKEKLDIEFVHRDMRRFSRHRAFDAALNLYTSFGYFKNPSDDANVLRNLHRSLKPGGKLLVDLMGMEIISRQFRKRDWREKDGTIFLEERIISPDWTWIENRWILLDRSGSRRREFKVSHRLYSARQLSELLHAAGFVKVRIFGDLSAAPYDQKASRLVLLATKT